MSEQSDHTSDPNLVVVERSRLRATWQIYITEANRIGGRTLMRHAGVLLPMTAHSPLTDA